MDGLWVKALLGLQRQGVVPTVMVFDPETFGSVGNLSALKEYLTSLGIAHEVITRQLLERQEARPGQSGHWEWRVTPLGRALPSIEQKELSWRDLNR